jgi:hypothetical protein
LEALVNVNRLASLNSKSIGLLLVLFLAVLPGCVQIEQTIHLNADRSGTITEVFRLDDRVVQSAKSDPALSALLDCLKEERAKERMPLFGDVTLASHTITDLDANGREAKTVYAFKDINKVFIPALPYRDDHWKSQLIAFNLSDPKDYHEAWRNAYYKVRTLRIFFAAIPNSPPQATQPAGQAAATPAEKEKLRAMLPIVRSMLKGFHASIKLESFAPIGTSKTHVIYDVTDEDFADDATLMKVLEWNKSHDPHLGEKSMISGRGGKIMTEPYNVDIVLPSAAPAADSTAPKKEDAKPAPEK